MTDYADPREVAVRAESWDESVLSCRTYGHVWQPLKAFHNKRLRYFEIVQLCPRCLTERNMEVSERGHVYASWYSYHEGYLSEGLGRIAGDGRDVLRLAAITRTFNVQSMSAKQSRELPRSLATREAVVESATVTPIKRGA